MSEIDLMIEDLAPAGRGEDDPADAIPEFGAKPQVTRPGDLWVLDRRRIYCGDARDGAAYSAVMKDRRADVGFVESSASF